MVFGNALIEIFNLGKMIMSFIRKSLRYQPGQPGDILIEFGDGQAKCSGYAVDLSETGLLVILPREMLASALEMQSRKVQGRILYPAKDVTVDFDGEIVRVAPQEQSGNVLVSISFSIAFIFPMEIYDLPLKEN